MKFGIQPQKGKIPNNVVCWFMISFTGSFCEGRSFPVYFWDVKSVF